MRLAEAIPALFILVLAGFIFAGTAGLGWEGEEFADDDLALCRYWLRSKGNSIEGGTSEVMLNVISKRILDLPGA